MNINLKQIKTIGPFVVWGLPYRQTILQTSQGWYKTINGVDLGNKIEAISYPYDENGYLLDKKDWIWENIDNSYLLCVNGTETLIEVKTDV